MSQDLVSDTLNNIMNAKRARKDAVVVKRYSKLLLNLLDIMKKHRHIDSYKVNETGKSVEIKIGKLNSCNSIKPRFYVSMKSIEKYIRRYLPAKDFGILIISTDKGLITHDEAIEKNVGGSLIAYVF